ncbi:hypothetical protein NP233_g9400 [Leucocoprinus birnbaumii]|uniref:Myb/SANT-like domain-containing protein n=1 Tax=Leucocoprinus birnbaumii TaxID=56174 RepID=A0AAD5YM91_9AGAR|nr:hypothetical protein NP233_g9400 [Leucocoprinus birnbaumii]
MPRPKKARPIPTTGNTSDKENDALKVPELRAIWTDTENAVMCHVLVEQKEKGNQSGAGWKWQVWTIVSDTLAQEVMPKGPAKDATKCADHWTNLKKSFNQVERVRNASGMGWDNALKICTATEEVWKALIAYLVHGVVATGAGAFHPGQTPVSSLVLMPSSPAAPADESLDDIVTSSTSDPVTDSSIAADLSGIGLPSSDDVPLKTPISRKQIRAESPDTPLRLTAPKKRNHRLRNDSSHAELVGALNQMAEALNSGPSTPIRRKSAINTFYMDGDFSEGEEDAILLLFTRDKDVMDTFSSIQVKEKRSQYLRSVLAKVEQ